MVTTEVRLIITSFGRHSDHRPSLTFSIATIQFRQVCPILYTWNTWYTWYTLVVNCKGPSRMFVISITNISLKQNFVYLITETYKLLSLKSGAKLMRYFITHSHEQTASIHTISLNCGTPNNQHLYHSTQMTYTNDSLYFFYNKQFLE